MPADGDSVLWDEARSETNGWFITGMAFNLLSPTSPQLDPIIEPLVDEYRHYQQQYSLDGDRLFIETYGPAWRCWRTLRDLRRSLAWMPRLRLSVERRSTPAWLSSSPLNWRRIRASWARSSTTRTRTAVRVDEREPLAGGEQHLA